MSSTTTVTVPFGTIEDGQVFFGSRIDCLLGENSFIKSGDASPDQFMQPSCPSCGISKKEGANTIIFSLGMPTHHCDDELVWVKIEGHRYYFISRPPDIGTHPAGEVRREVWYPAKDIPNTERHGWGWVEYAEPLEFEQVWKYELFPADDEELDAYYDWRNEVGK